MLALAGLGIPLQQPRGEERAAQFLQLVIVIYLCVEGLLFHSVLIKTSPISPQDGGRMADDFVSNGQGLLCSKSVTLEFMPVSC